MADRIREIQNWWASNEGKGTQADLDRWLTTSGYTASEINAALPQFGVADLNAAIRNAQAQQEIVDRQARREALRQQNPGQEIIVSNGGEPTQTLNRTPMSAVPQNEYDAARAKLDAETANYMDWYLNQINPMTNERNSDIAARQGVNPYADPNALRGAKEAMDRANRRESMGLGYSAEWKEPDWKEIQALKEADEKAYWNQRAADAAKESFVAGPNATTIGPSNPVQQLTGQAPAAQSFGGSTGYSATPQMVGATGSGPQASGGFYQSNLIKSLRAASAVDNPQAASGVSFMPNQANTASGGSGFGSQSNQGLIFNPQPTTLDAYDPTPIFQEIYGRNPTGSELEYARTKRPADLRTTLEQSLAEWQAKQNPQQQQTTPQTPNYNFSDA